MKKIMFATLAMVSAFAFAGGPAPTADAAPAQTNIGACRYFCGNDAHAYTTRASCQAVCSTACDAIC